MALLQGQTAWIEAKAVAGFAFHEGQNAFRSKPKATEKERKRSRVTVNPFSVVWESLFLYFSPPVETTLRGN
jgi:hypothetical protein